MIAQLANVSIGTVDRVLHNRAGVAEKTRDKVLKIIEELNYKPNIIARRLVSKKKYNLAVLIPQPTEENQYWKLHEPGIKKAEEEILELGVFIERLPYDQNDPQSFIAQSSKIMEGDYDGILLVPFFKNESLRLIENCTQKNIPYIFFDTNLLHEKFQPLSYVGQDAFKSGYFAGKLIGYLLKKEETALAVSINSVKPADNHVNYIQREEGLKQYVKESGAFQLNSFHFNSFEMNDKSLETELLNTLQKDSSIKVLFITNSRAHKIALVLEKNKIQDLKVIGYDLIDPNIHYLNNGYIDFLISQEPFNQTYQGIMALFSNLILNQKVEKEKWLPITLILKENLEFFRF